MSFVQPKTDIDEANRFDTKTYGQQWLGTLMLVFPKEVKTDFDTGKYKPTDVVVADIIFVDGPEAGRFFRETFIFSKPIVGATKGHIGEPVLGRFDQKQYTEGVGWYLAEYSDADVALATPVLNQYQAGAFKQPTVTPAAPPAASVSAWNPTPAPPDPWNLPQTPAPVAATAPTLPQAPAVALDPELVKFLQSKGVNTTNLDPQTAAMIAATLK